MGVNTTRVGLYKPGGGSSGTILPDENADVDKINQNSDRLDEVVGAPLYSSTSLPGSAVRFDGMLIYEEDTGYLKIYVESSTSWVVPFAISPLGKQLMSAATAKEAREILGIYTGSTDPGSKPNESLWFKKA